MERTDLGLAYPHEKKKCDVSRAVSTGPPGGGVIYSGRWSCCVPYANGSRRRWYSPRCPMSVTGAGRWLLSVMMICTRVFRDSHIVYCDTDSTFISPGQETLDYCIAMISPEDDREGNDNKESLCFYAIP